MEQVEKLLKTIWKVDEVPHPQRVVDFLFVRDALPKSYNIKKNVGKQSQKVLNDLLVVIENNFK